MKLEALIRKTFSLRPGIRIADSHGLGLLEGWDSLGHMRLLEALKRAYGIEIGLAEAKELEDVRRIKELLRRKGVSEF